MSDLSDYQPIETAPKDGTLISGCRNAADSFQLFLCHWDGECWRIPPSILNTRCHPTHWKPVERKTRAKDR